MRALILVLMVGGCGAEGLDPIADLRSESATDEPDATEPEQDPNVSAQLIAPALPIVVNLSDNLSDIMIAEIDHFHAVTGIAKPDVAVGDCELGRGYCITYGTPPAGKSIDGQALYPWGIVINQALRTNSDNHLLLLHEYAHLWIFPSLGIDGTGHTNDGSVMSKDATKITCLAGLSVSTISMLCDHRECVEPVPECP